MNEENKPLRVLIADDHAPTRDDVRRALDADGRFSICSEVSDAAEAVQAAMRKQPDICLLDIRMPGSGLAAAWEIAARLPRVKIVMLTVSVEDTDLFTFHRTPPCENCAVGGNILEAMRPTLDRARKALEQELSKVTIADIADEVARLGKFTIPLVW